MLICDRGGIGSQALKALKEAGVKSVLINPNIATIQTNHFIADEIYYRTYAPCQGSLLARDSVRGGFATPAPVL